MDNNFEISDYCLLQSKHSFGKKVILFSNSPQIKHQVHLFLKESVYTLEEGQYTKLEFIYTKEILSEYALILVDAALLEEYETDSFHNISKYCDKDSPFSSIIYIFDEGHQDDHFVDLILSNNLSQCLITMPQSSKLFLQKLDQTIQSIITLNELKSTTQINSLMKKAIDFSRNAITIADMLQPDHPLMYVNKSFEEMTGYSKDEIIGKNCRFLQGNDTDQPIIQEMHNAIHNGKNLTGLVRNYKKNGEMYWNEFTFSPIYNRNNILTHCVGVSADVTQKVKLIEDLEAANKAVMQASESKSLFLANMSHEIRTPINGILGATQILLDQKLSPEQHEYMELIKISGDTLLALVNDILDYSKMEAGRIELDPLEFNFRELVNNTLKTFKPLANQKKIWLQSDIPESMPQKVIGDSLRIRQILFNLLSNAVKFTETGGVSIEITWSQLTNEKICCGFTVIDTGIGIAKENQSLIFDKFSQAERSTTRRFGGTGLGLAISKKLAEMMGGRIWVTSELHRGSAFHVEIQLLLPSIQYDELSSEQKEVFKKLSALVITKEEKMMSAFKKLTEKIEMPTHFVTNSLEGVQAINRQSDSGTPYSVIFVDESLASEYNDESLEKNPLFERINASVFLSRKCIQLVSKNKNILSTDNLFETSEPNNISEDILVSPLPLKSENILPKPLLENTLLGFVLGKFNQYQQSSCPEITAHHFSDKMPSNSAIAQPILYEKPNIPIEEKESSQDESQTRILIIEDNLINQKVFYYNLIRNGYLVDTAENGIEGLKLFDKNVYSLILMDIEMPEMDGYETSKNIRQREAQYSKKRTPILAISARALKGENEACLRAGMDHYLCKPVQNDDLLSMVNKILNQKEDFIG